MSTTQTKKLSEATVVQSVADADKIPIVNSSGQTVLVPLSGLLGAIKVGGRNLVKNSGVQVVSKEYPMKYYKYGERPQVGERLMVTLWGTLGQGTSDFAVYNGDGDGSYGAVILDKISEGVFQGILHINKEAGCLSVFPRGQRTSPSTIERIKVERGNIPTDWTPAPEDWGGVKTSLSAVCAFVAQLSAWKGGSHERYANEVLPRMDGKPNNRDFSLGLQRTMGRLRRRGTKEPQSAASPRDTEMRRCGHSRCRMGENGNSDGQYSDGWQWRMAAHDAIRFGRNNTTVLLLDDSTKSLYPQKKFGWRKHRLGQLDSARFRSVATRKEVAV